MKVFKFCIFLYSRKSNEFSIQLLHKMKYFINNVIFGWNLFLVLLKNSSFSIHLKWPKNEADLSKWTEVDKMN